MPLDRVWLARVDIQQDSTHKDAMLTNDEILRLKERLDGRRRPGKLSLVDREALLRCYISGATMTDIGIMFGVSQQTVSYHVRRATFVRCGE